MANMQCGGEKAARIAGKTLVVTGQDLLNPNHHTKCNDRGRPRPHASDP
jgi:hypothetical protein